MSPYSVPPPPIKSGLTQAIQLAAKFLEARDTMRRFFGERYQAKVAPFRRTLAALAHATQTPLLGVAKEMLKQFQSDDVDGITQALLIAAIVEESESPTILEDVKRALAGERPAPEEARHGE